MAFEHPLTRPLRELLRWFYQGPLVRLIELDFHRRFPEHRAVRFQSRHSSKTGHRFNPFASDLDLSAFAFEVSEALAFSLANHVSRWRRHLPFVGELEIYSFAEKESLDLLMKSFGNLYDFLKPIRKILWMEREYEKRTTRYHRAKALRAVQICLDQIGPGLRARPTSNILQVVPYIEAFVRRRFGDFNSVLLDKGPRSMEPQTTSYLGFQVSDQLGLSKQAAMILMGLTPDSRGYEFVRRDPQIFAGFIALTEMELLIFRAVYRAQINILPWMNIWLERLESIAAEYRQVSKWPKKVTSVQESFHSQPSASI